ncbi:MAG TPA: SPOR domain-containing protein [Geminicoccaceae bacterium]
MVSDRITTADFGRGRGRAPDPPPYYRSQHRRTRWLLILLPVLAIFVGFGSIVWLAYVEGAPASAIGEPPLIKADARPIKLAPDDPGGREVPDQGEVDELLAGARSSSGTERLLPPPEEPMVPPSPEELAATVEDLGEEVGADPGGAEADPPVETARQGSGGGSREAPAAAAAAGGEADAVDRAAPEEAEQAIRELFQDEEGTRLATAPDQRREAPQVLRPEPTPEASARAPAARAPSPEVAEAPAGPAPGERDAQSAARAADPPPSEPPPSEPAAGVRTTPAVAPAARLAAPASDVALDGPHFRVQLAAVRNEADAQRAWDLFRADYGDVLAGVEPIFERGETTNGVFYRVQLGPYAELNRAERLCEELKQRNASCFVLRR